MEMKFLGRIFLALMTLSFLGACGGKGGFNTLGLNETPSRSASSENPPPGSPLPTEFQKLQYKGYVSGGSNDGTLVVDLDKTNGALLLVLPLQVNSFIGSAEGGISDLPGLKFMTYRDERGASYLALSVPLRYVLKGASYLKPSRLPNGDALPQVASGELPSVALRLPGKNDVQFHLYLGVNVVGVYLSSPYDPYQPLHFPIRRGVETIGYFHTVPAKSGFNGGFFLNAQMPDSIAAIIDDHFRF